MHPDEMRLRTGRSLRLWNPELGEVRGPPQYLLQMCGQPTHEKLADFCCEHGLVVPADGEEIEEWRAVLKGARGLHRESASRGLVVGATEAVERAVAATAMGSKAAGTTSAHRRIDDPADLMFLLASATDCRPPALRRVTYLHQQMARQRPIDHSRAVTQVYRRSTSRLHTGESIYEQSALASPQPWRLLGD